MPILIHGKEYKTVAERLNEAHAANDILGVNTEVLFLEPQVMVKATIITQIGTFTGISAADPNKSIEAKTPVEVAETSAVGRALAFAGYVGAEIASADEIKKAEISDPRVPAEIKSTVFATDKQIYAINKMIKEGQLPPELAKKIPSMTAAEASQHISSVWGTK